MSTRGRAMFKRSGSGRAGLPYKVGVFLGKQAAKRSRAIARSRVSSAEVNNIGIRRRPGRLVSGLAYGRLLKKRYGQGRRKCPKMSPIFRKKVRCAIMDDKELYYQALAGVTTAGDVSAWNVVLGGSGTNVTAGTNSLVIGQPFSIVELTSAMPQGDTNITRSGDSVQIMKYEYRWNTSFNFSPGDGDEAGHPGCPWIMCEWFLCEIVGNDQSIPSGGDFTTARVTDRTWYGRDKRPEYFDVNVAVASTAVKRKLWKILKRGVRVFQNPMFQPNYTAAQALSIAGATPQVFVPTYRVQLNQASATTQSCHTEVNYGSWSFGKEGRELSYKTSTGLTSDITKGRQFLAYRLWTPSDVASTYVLGNVELRTRMRYKD